MGIADVDVNILNEHTIKIKVSPELPKPHYTYLPGSSAEKKVYPI